VPFPLPLPLVVSNDTIRCAAIGTTLFRSPRIAHPFSNIGTATHICSSPLGRAETAIGFATLNVVGTGGS
jgi:hypothetical protein